jgi:hypothetical protein
MLVATFGFLLLSLVFIVNCQHQEACEDSSTYPIGGGEFFSQNYPESYPNNANCTYYLQTPAGSVLSIRFDDFDTEACCDHLNIYDGPSLTSPVLGK